MKTNLFLVAGLLMGGSLSSVGEVFMQYFPDSRFWGVSQNGDYAFGSSSPGITAFVRDSIQGVRAIPQPENNANFAITDVSDSGIVAGYLNTSAGSHQFNSGFIAYTSNASLNPDRFNYLRNDSIQISGISADGRFAVGATTAYTFGNNTAYRYTLADMTRATIVDQTGRLSEINLTGVSYNGSVVVGSGYANLRSEAIIWTEAGGVTSLGILSPGSIYSRASAVSPDGNTVVGESGFEAFIWTPDGGMTGLGVLPGRSYSSATDISANGIIVGASGVAGQSGSDAFIYTEEGGMRLLGSGISVTGISGDGTTIVGFFLGGSRQGFIAHDPTAEWLQLIAVPEPSDYAVCFAGASALFVALRRISKSRD